MRVFVSWAGEQSRQVGEALRNWLPNVHQRVEIFFSPSDIEKGAKWTSEIDGQLRDTRFCIVCLTAEALQSQWINFETGAISKGIGQNRIAPVLLNLAKADVSGPLSLFQLADFTKTDINQVVQSLNNAFEEERLAEDILARAFDRWWPDLEGAVLKILKDSPARHPPPKPQREVLEETLLNTREIIKQMGGLSRGRTNRPGMNLLIGVNSEVTRLYDVIADEEFEQGLARIQPLGRRIVELNSALGKSTGGSLERLKSWVNTSSTGVRKRPPLRRPGVASKGPKSGTGDDGSQKR